MLASKYFLVVSVNSKHITFGSKQHDTALYSVIDVLPDSIHAVLYKLLWVVAYFMEFVFHRA